MCVISTLGFNSDVSGLNMMKWYFLSVLIFLFLFGCFFVLVTVFKISVRNFVSNAALRISVMSTSITNLIVVCPFAVVRVLL